MEGSKTIERIDYQIIVHDSGIDLQEEITRQNQDHSEPIASPHGPQPGP